MVCHIINDSYLPANSDSCHSKTSIQIFCTSICQMSMKEFLIFLIQVTTNHLVTKILEFFIFSMNFVKSGKFLLIRFH